MIKQGHFPLICMNYNQDGTCVAIGTTKGFKIFNTDPFKELYSHDFADGCSIVSMLYRSSILAITGAGNNVRYPKDSVTLYDDQSGRNLGCVELHRQVLNVQLTREKLFISTDALVKVHNITDLKEIDSLSTCTNPTGILAIQGDKDTQMLCLGQQPGEVIVRLYNTEALVNSMSFQCHENALRCAAFSTDGLFFATASLKGTLIRIFSVKDKKLIKELRRGSNDAVIHSIAFSPDNTKIACTSDHSTLHIFCAVVTDDQQNQNKKSDLKFLSGINKFFDSEWSFAKAQLSCVMSICRFISNDTIVVTQADGNIIKFKMVEGQLAEECRSDMLNEE